MRSPWNDGNISLRCAMCVSSSSSSTEWLPSTGSSTTFASPAWSSRGSPVKICFTASGSVTKTHVPSLAILSVNVSP